MNSFAERIRGIEARMNQLKTYGLSSSASVSTISKTLTVSMHVVPYKVNYQWDNCAGEYSYRITVNWTDNPGICSAYIKSPANLQNRRYSLSRLSNSSNSCQFGLVMVAGSDDDLDLFNSGGSIPAFDLTVEIVASANFNISYVSRKEH